MYILSFVEPILYFIGQIQTILSCLYTLLLSVGHIAVLAVIELYRFISNITYTSGDVLKVLKEDFEVFQHDLLVLITPTLNWIQESTLYIFICSQRSYLFLLSICEGFNACINNILNIYHCFKWSVDKSLVLIFDSLCLIGNAFISCSNLLIKISSKETLCQWSSVVYSYLANLIRLEAVFGVLILTFLTMITIKSRIHLKLFNVINLLFLKCAVSSCHGFKLFLMVVPLFISVVKNNWTSVKYGLYKYVRKKEELSKLSRDDLQRLLEEEKAEKLCVICMDRKRNIILLNCQHMILCNICVSTILDDNALCPVCRRVIFDIITVYT